MTSRSEPLMMEGGMTAKRWLELEKNGDATLTLEEMYCGFDGRKVTE